ncbi:hypothetical protein LK09_08240 [Microbacterium mangrovi]|uniref:UDP-N-acetylglucosamine kinase n=2 Tax=Microbacterium mangrovi TaxID=1348253 RepID=A0A0B2AB86_9MICO|nr:hypothetical protein LK09_08240 [Microbacterium mangrovi]
MAAALAHAKKQRVSVVIEDSFRSAADVLSALDTFAKDGYKARVVAVAVSRAESLLAAYSRESRRNPDQAVADHSLVRSVETDMAVMDMVLTGLSEDTDIVLISADGRDYRVNSVREAVLGTRRIRDAPLSSRRAAAWISELRRLTGDGRSRSAALMELHRVALADVIPHLPLPANSAARAQLEARLRRGMSELERSEPLAYPEVPRPTR